LCGRLRGGRSLDPLPDADNAAVGSQEVFDDNGDILCFTFQNVFFISERRRTKPA